MMGSRGNALFLILIAVALFAALSYAITQSARGGGDISKQQTTIQAAQLMQYFADMDAAVKQMMLTGGVQDYQLNFYYQSNNNFVFGSLDNTNCTTSNCRVFDPAGGGVGGQHLQSYTRTNMVDPERILYIAVPNVGTAAGSDVLFYLAQPATALCKEINNKMGLGNVIIYNTAAITSTLPNPIYQVAAPVGPIPDNLVGWTGTGVTPAMAQAGTWCDCQDADQTSCEADTFHMEIIHVLIAR